MFVRAFTVFSLVFLTASCSVVPDEIDVADEKALVNYKQAATNNSAAVGSTARWGGLIVEVENKPDKTFVEIVHFPLNHYGRPNTSDETIGRFKVQIDGFVDPIIFEKGRAVTFVGEVAQPVAGMVGEQPYTYPLIKAENYHFWREVTTYDISPLYFNYGTGWYSPFYYRYSPYAGWGYGANWGYNPGWGFPSSRIRVIESRRFKPDISGSAPQKQPARQGSMQRQKMPNNAIPNRVHVKGGGQPKKR